MEKKKYRIRGFDCASCAENAECHLNDDPRISSARIDYSGETLFLEFDGKALTIPQIKEIIAEVEEDEIELYLEGRKKCVYRVDGFDCPNCALEAERLLASQPGVSEANVDYVNHRLYLESEGGSYQAEDIEALIRMELNEPIEVSPLEEKKEKRFDLKSVLLLVRIGLALATFFLCGFFFKDLYWVRFGLYLATLIVIEYDIAWKVVMNIVRRRNTLDEYLLILVASVGAFVLACVGYAQNGEAVAFGNQTFMMEEHYEAILVCLLWQIGELLQDFAVKRSRLAVEKAVDSRVETALLFQDGTSTRVDAKTLVAGSLVIVPAGEIVPIDGEVILGEGYCDTSSLTGESMPVFLQEGSSVYAGTVMTSGEVRVRASKDYASSSSAKILDLVTSSMQRKGTAERFITKFARIYTPVIFLTALLYIGIALISGQAWQRALYTGLEIMVISCPCALVISVPLAYFAAIGLASKNGIVIKGANFLDALLGVNLLASDKTGTLTKGEFVIDGLEVLGHENETEVKEILSCLESHSSHPIGKAVVQGLGRVKSRSVENFASLPGLGVEGDIEGIHYAAGNTEHMRRLGLNLRDEEAGLTIYLARGNELLGKVALRDEVKTESQRAIKALQQAGIEVLVLSGDKQSNVDVLTKELGINGGRGSLLPEDKLSFIEAEKAKEGRVVAYLGDGVNDAPCLARADVGIAMAGLGSSLAVEEADVLLLRDDPMSVVKALRIAKSCRRTVVFNIAFAIAVKVAVMVLAISLGEKMPMEVAVLADTGVSVLLTLNSLLLLSRRV